MTLVAALDVGGSSVKAALVDERGNPSSIVRIPTPTDDPRGAELTLRLTHQIAKWRSEHDVVAVGVAVPGVFDLDSESVLLSSNLEWRDVPIGALLRQHVDLPLAVSHDIRAGALAEARYGALRESTTRSLFAAVGTGVSVAVVDGASNVSYGDPWQGEIGQLHVSDPFHTDPARPAPLRPVESFASAHGIATSCGAANSQEALERARNGDPAAQRAWELGIAGLGEVLAAAAISFGTTTLVVGGGLALAEDAFFVPLTDAVNRHLPSNRAVSTVPARLGDLAGCIGAAVSAFDLSVREPEI